MDFLTIEKNLQTLKNLLSLDLLIYIANYMVILYLNTPDMLYTDIFTRKYMHIKVYYMLEHMMVCQLPCATQCSFQ